MFSYLIFLIQLFLFPGHTLGVQTHKSGGTQETKDSERFYIDEVKSFFVFANV